MAMRRGSIYIAEISRRQKSKVYTYYLLRCSYREGGKVGVYGLFGHVTDEIRVRETAPASPWPASGGHGRLTRPGGSRTRIVRGSRPNFARAPIRRDAPRAVERPLGVNLIDPALERHFIRRWLDRLVVQPGAVQAQKPCLGAQRQCAFPAL